MLHASTTAGLSTHRVKAFVFWSLKNIIHAPLLGLPGSMKGRGRKDMRRDQGGSEGACLVVRDSPSRLGGFGGGNNVDFTTGGSLWMQKAKHFLWKTHFFL